LCTELAASAGLPGTFAAWVSTEKDSPDDRFTKSTLPYVKLDNTIVALDWEDLVDGTLVSPIDLTEYGASPTLEMNCNDGEVWTNTNPDGTARGFEACQNWTLADPKGIAEIGRLTEKTSEWTATATCGSLTCATALPIYCFEQ
jgi:hypothetical protein